MQGEQNGILGGGQGRQGSCFLKKLEGSTKNDPKINGWKQINKQTNQQTKKHTNKQTNKQTWTFSKDAKQDLAALVGVATLSALFVLKPCVLLSVLGQEHCRHL